jgi:hypothetical protein
MKEGVGHVYSVVGMEYASITLNFNLFNAGINLDRHKTPTCEGHMFSLSLEMNDLEGSE